MKIGTVAENTYYIDRVSGDDACDGTDPSRPFRTYAGRKFAGGDTVLFKRGSVIRDVLQPCNGCEGAPVTYGAYGEGDKPAFLGSVSAGDPGNVCIRNNIFYETPYGMAIYSIISQNDERKFIFDRNLYWQSSGDRLIYLGGKVYLPSEFESYQSESGQDAESILAKPLFGSDYRQRADSPGPGMGMR